MATSESRRLTGSEISAPPENGHPATISVRDLLERALPAGSTVAGGEGGLGRDVTWATRLRPAPPAFEHLSGGELVLLPPHVLEHLDERLTLAEAIRQLAVLGVAAVGVAESPDPAAVSAADQTDVPLILLPEATDFGTLERITARSISERRREIQRRGQEAGRQLMELAIAGEPLSALARELTDLARRPVAFEGRDGRLLAFGQGPSDLSAADIEMLLAETRGPVSAWLRSVGATSSAEPPSARYPIGTSWVRIVAPVIGRDGFLGNVSVFAPPDDASVEDGVLASRGAAACAVTLAREHAAASARREIELNVLDEILDGALRSEISLLQQVKRLGHDLTLPHCTIIVRVEPAAGTAARARDGRWSVLEEGLNRAARSRGARILWRVRNTSAEIVWPIADEDEVAGIVASVRDELNAAVAMHASSELVSLGVGRVRSGLDGIRQSHQDARQALTIGRRLHGPGTVMSFENLGVYRLIYAAENLPELRTFQEEALGSLIAYDESHGAELVRTLEAFFTANCSPKEAASLLHVHRNTVLYRLERIADITGLDLNAADVRLRLHLSLHVRLALLA